MRIWVSRKVSRSGHLGLRSIMTKCKRITQNTYNRIEILHKYIYQSRIQIKGILNCLRFMPALICF